uniref:Transporter n=1 Tax=Romanomermis culicivorax TaxID=13658 RepID=A0A915LC59_ROMCU
MAAKSTFDGTVPGWQNMLPNGRHNFNAVKSAAKSDFDSLSENSQNYDQQRGKSCRCSENTNSGGSFSRFFRTFIPKSLKMFGGKATENYYCYHCNPGRHSTITKKNEDPTIDGSYEEQKLEGSSSQEKSVKPERGHWSGRTDFLMSLIAYAVGLGNVWRFPYLCFKNGGGVGIANTLIAIFCNIYFPIIVAWAIFFVISSFANGSDLPWQTCDREWNNKLCLDIAAGKNLSDWTSATGLNLSESQSPVTQFWEQRVLQTSVGIEETGGIQYELLALLALVWILTYFALWKGITNCRKLVYFCAISPYVLLVILLIRGITLTGAWDGIKYYLKPNPTMLLKAEVWKDAGTQIFYSTGIGFGTLVALGSYNTYNHNVYRDSIILCVVNSMTSLVAGFVVFSVLGYMANVANKTVDQVVKSGVGLAFLVYPEAISTMPISKLWSLLFFLMIVILGLDSLVCMVEGVVLAFTDKFPHTLRKHKKLFLAALCTIGFILGSGQFWLTLVDSYGASGISLLFVVFFEIIALSWVFGTKNIYRALEDMLSYRPTKFWHFSWKYTAPIVCIELFNILILVVLILRRGTVHSDSVRKRARGHSRERLTCEVIFSITIYDYTPLMYPDNRTPYPKWAMIVGFIISSTSILSIPFYAFYYVLKTPGSLKEAALRFDFGAHELPYVRGESRGLPRRSEQ